MWQSAKKIKIAAEHTCACREFMETIDRKQAANDHKTQKNLNASTMSFKHHSRIKVSPLFYRKISSEDR